SEVATFHNNMTATFNVFWAAVRLGIRKIVYASSETVLGLPFDIDPPYAPVDEEYAPRPESVYSLVKTLEERMADELVRWYPDLSMTALRSSNVMVPEDYEAFGAFDDDATKRKWNLWGYIDARDGAQAVERALEVAPAGFDQFIIAAADTVMTRPNSELLAEVFPDVPLKKAVGDHETLLSIDKARRLLGYEPKHSWRDRPCTSPGSFSLRSPLCSSSISSYTRRFTGRPRRGEPPSVRVRRRHRRRSLSRSIWASTICSLRSSPRWVSSGRSPARIRCPVTRSSSQVPVPCSLRRSCSSSRRQTSVRRPSSRGSSHCSPS